MIPYFGLQCQQKYVNWPRTVKPVSYINHGTRKRHSSNIKNEETAWNKIGVHLFEIKGINYLVTVADYYSNFIDVDYLSTTTTKQVVTKLKGHFARYGMPMQMVTNSVSQFLSKELKNFTRNWVIGHVTSLPQHQVEWKGRSRGKGYQNDDAQSTSEWYRSI